MPELKPCPFCGPDFCDVQEFDGETFCNTCGCRTDEDVWQARPIEDALHARAVEAERKLAVAVEALKELCELGHGAAFDDCVSAAVVENVADAALREIGGE